MLILLDIDGTLCDTFDIDGDCYVESLHRCFGFSDISTDWGSYPETTDSAILQSVFASKLNRSPTALETTQMVDCFHGLLQQAFNRDPNQCKAITGGPSFVSKLRSSNVPFAVATGGWRQTARLKLESAGYANIDFPMSTADDFTCRTDICRLAVEQASQLHGKQHAPVVYIGDGLWDQKAADTLGYCFVGRSTEETAFKDGCSFVVADFCDLNLLERLRELELGA